MTVIGKDTNTTAGSGSPTVSQLVCGTMNGCIAVYKHAVEGEKGGHEKGDQ